MTALHFPRSYEVHVHVPGAAPAQPSGSGHVVALVVGIVVALLVLGVVVRVGFLLVAWNRGFNAVPASPWPARAPQDLPVRVVEVLPDGRVQVYWEGSKDAWDEVRTRDQLRTPGESAGK
jgi:hypothetical protein